MKWKWSQTITTLTCCISSNSDFVVLNMVHTFFSFLVLPAASSCRLLYFSSMSNLSACLASVKQNTDTRLQYRLASPEIWCLIVDVNLVFDNSYNLDVWLQLKSWCCITVINLVFDFSYKLLVWHSYKVGVAL